MRVSELAEIANFQSHLESSDARHDYSPGLAFIFRQTLWPGGSNVLKRKEMLIFAQT